MKSQNKNYWFCWFLLFCFVTGQLAVLSHRHVSSKRSVSQVRQNYPTPKHTLSEKCSLCDVMQHTQMSLNSVGPAFFPLITSAITYKARYDFKCISLILAKGRAPPEV